MVDAGVKRTTQKRLDLIAELYRVLGPHMHLIGLRIEPCLDDRKMVGSIYLLQNEIGNQTCILFGCRGLGAKQSPRVFLGLRHIRIGPDVDLADDGDRFALIFALVLGIQPGNRENGTHNGKCHGK